MASIYEPVLEERGDEGSRKLAVSLFTASPRVSMVRPGLCRADPRGWERLGGEEAFAETVRASAGEAGFPTVQIGIADTGVTADIAARIATSVPLIVPVGGTRSFLSTLPLSLLPISEELRATFLSLGWKRIGEVALQARSELEARFGPEGIQAHRWSLGEGNELVPTVAPDEEPAASFELEGPVATLEPLLFVLRHLLTRVCTELVEGGWCAASLVLVLELEDDRDTRTGIMPARPTAREDFLFDLCRAALEREFERSGLTSPVSCLVLRVCQRTPAEARQRDLFACEPRDPLATAATLSRLSARLGEGAIVRPAPREDHRPETRNGWKPVTARGEIRKGDREVGLTREESTRDGPDPSDSPLPSTLRLLPRPLSVRVRTAKTRPLVVWDDCGRHEVIAAEGPERISGDWWKAPFRREYYRVCTSNGELLWLFREREKGDDPRWHLHGWWD